MNHIAQDKPVAGPLFLLGVEIVKINTANGWNVLEPDQWGDTYKVPAVLALIHSEVSEALEGFRHDDKANFEEELADILIRVLDCGHGLGLNLDAAVRAKLNILITTKTRETYPVGALVRYRCYSAINVGRVSDHLHDDQVLIKSAISNRTIPIRVTDIIGILPHGARAA